MNGSTTPIAWITAAESYFLRAEGALRGWNMGGSAQHFYNQGVGASFCENGMSADPAVYAADHASVPVAFTDNSGQSGNNVGHRPALLQSAGTCTTIFRPTWKGSLRRNGSLCILMVLKAGLSFVVPVIRNCFLLWLTTAAILLILLHRYAVLRIRYRNIIITSPVCNQVCWHWAVRMAAE